MPDFTISGGGYTPGEGVTISGGPFSSFQVTADGAGAFVTKRQTDAKSRLGAYRITALGAASGVSHFFDVFLTRFDLYNTSASGNMAVAAGASDDTGQPGPAVPGAQVELVSTAPPFARQTATADEHGVAVFSNISVGVPHTYNVTAANHSNMTGTHTAQDETTQTVAVVLPVRAIQTTWTVTPTTITDVYDINLQLRYEVDVPLPRLAVDPTQFAYTKDPAAPAGPMLLNNSSVTSGDMTVYNPSRITVNNIVVDASAVQGVNVTLSYGGQSGASVTIPSIPPLSNVKVHYATSAFCPVATLSSQIMLHGEYTYSPVVPTLSMSENAWTVAVPAGGSVAKDLVLSNTGYNVATGIAVSATAHPRITMPHNVVDLGLGNTAPFRVVVAPPAYPMPQLVLDYYVPRDVEANKPVKLGVVVRNTGAGQANNLKIVSGQPHLISNAGGVLVTFGLLGGSVKGSSVPTSNLTLDFGNLPGNSQTWGYWILSADLEGQFTAFTATYTQRDYRGATLSPLILAVHTNIIVQGDVVPSGGQSMQVVSPALGVDPNALLDLETGIATPMETRYITGAQLATLGDPVTRYGTAASGGYVLAVTPDPLPSTPITSVRADYPDGSNAQLWNGSGMVWRGRDPQGDKVYVVDTPRGGVGAISNYAISYGASQTAPVLHSAVGGAHTAALTWTHPGGGTAGLTGYLVYRHPSGTPKNTALLVATLGPTETAYTDAGLAPGYYTYFVRASYGDSSTADSLEKQVRVQKGAVVTFEQTGLPSGMTGFVVVDGQRHDLPYSVALGTDRPHTYSFPETLHDPSDPTGIRYVFTAPPASSGALDTTTAYTLRATYTTQYYLRVQTNPASLKPALTGLTAAQ